ncbi:MAG: Hpt domain-containing protein [Alphaproteobacteria bacterium]
MSSEETSPKDVKIIKPKVDLRSKAPEISESLDDLIAKADAAVAEMAQEYPARVEEELGELSVLVDQATAAVGEPQKERLLKIYEYAHDFKGQGGTFGYALISRIGGSLCRLLHGKDTIKQAEADLVKAHYDALRVVIAKDISGDGGKIGDKLTGGLEEATTRFANEDAE